MFIAFEGVEGTGKSKLRNLTAFVLEQANIPVYVHGEPREDSTWITNRNSSVFDYHDILTNELAKRFSAYRNVIRPNLREGVNVITNQWNATTIAYYGYGRDMGYLSTRNACFTEANQDADVTFYVQSNYSDIYEKLNLKNELPSYMLDHNIEFYTKVCYGYDEIAKKRNDFYFINAMQSFEQQLCEIIKVLIVKFNGNQKLRRLINTVANVS